MLVEIVAVVAVLGFALVVFLLLDARSEAQSARAESRAHQADATVQRARATKYKKVLETWGEDVEELERKIEVAHGGKVGPALERLTERIRSLHENGDRGETGPGGEDGAVPPAKLP